MIDLTVIDDGLRKKYLETYQKNMGKTLLDEKRYVVLLALVEQCMEIKGDLAECGVYKGGSAAGIVSVVTSIDPHRSVHLFDTFEGIPHQFQNNDKFDEIHDMKDYSIDDVRNLFDRCIIHVGTIPDTLTEVEERYFSFVHIDLNYYEPTKDALEFFYERVSPDGVILIDDYGFEMYSNTIKRAVDEFSHESGVKLIPLDNGQCIICGSKEEDL